LGKSGKDLDRAADIAKAGWGITSGTVRAYYGGSNTKGPGGFKPASERKNLTQSSNETLKRDALKTLGRTEFNIRRYEAMERAQLQRGHIRK